MPYYFCCARLLLHLCLFSTPMYIYQSSLSVCVSLCLSLRGSSGPQIKTCSRVHCVALYLAPIALLSPSLNTLWCCDERISGLQSLRKGDIQCVCVCFIKLHPLLWLSSMHMFSCRFYLRRWILNNQIATCSPLSVWLSVSVSLHTTSLKAPIYLRWWTTGSKNVLERLRIVGVWCESLLLSSLYFLKVCH